jgi:hypothetical protein
MIENFRVWGLGFKVLNPLNPFDRLNPLDSSP